MSEDITTNDLVIAPPVHKTLAEHLKAIDYTALNSGYMVPSEFALKFAALIQLINGEQGEENKTPPVHLAMLDNIVGKRQRTVNLCHRGLGKTTLIFEYLTLYLALTNHLPGFGEVTGMLYISNAMEKGVADARRGLEERYMTSDFLQKHITEAKFTQDYITFKNVDGGKLGIRMYGAQTPPRGVRIFKKRPVLAILDDLIGDGDAPSKIMMDKIKETVYSGVNFALHPQRKKIILSGTPFVNNDIMIEAAESGDWYTNIYPVCEKFPCTKEEFVGSWPERFPYEYVKKEYDSALKNGKLGSFYKELMMQITNEEDRLVSDEEIASQWYDRDKLLRNRHNFNFYVTTDFAFTGKEKSDYSVISVWAYNNNADWFWVDGMCGRVKIDEALDTLINLCQIYNPKTVGIETGGPQSAIIPWILEKQQDRNVFFTLARQKGKPGINPGSMDKLGRFCLVVPWFKDGKIFFPKQLEKSPIMTEFIREIELATLYKLKGMDDCLDTISMLVHMNPQKPSIAAAPKPKSGIYSFDFDMDGDNYSPIDDLVV